MLLTPRQEIGVRIDSGALTRFVTEVERELAGYCTSTPAPVDVLQVGCAMLPGHRLIIEVQTFPAEARVFHARQITQRLRQLDVPVVAGPVVFARRMCLRSADQAQRFRPPFSALATGAEAAPLDRILCEAGGVSQARETVWNRLSKSLAPGRMRGSAEDGRTIGAQLAERIRVFVAVANKAVTVAGAQPPFAIVKKDKPLTTVRYPNGANGYIDELTLEHAVSHAPHPTQAALDGLFEKVARIRVLEGGMAHGKALGRSVLLDVMDAADIKELCGRLAILDGPAGHCMCLGDPSLQLLSATGDSLAVIGLHHGHGLRWSAWKDDASLLDGLALLEWFAGRGVEGPLAKYHEAQREREKQNAAQQRWAAAMPAGFNGISAADWQQMAESNDLVPALGAIFTAHPNRNDAILALLRWLGSGLGPWSGFPQYEQMAERLLLLVPIDDLVKALDASQVSPTHLEGAARFFSSSLFAAGGCKPIPLKTMMAMGAMHIYAPKHPGVPADIPIALRHRLLAHCLASDDADKKNRARSAFSDR